MIAPTPVVPGGLTTAVQIVTMTVMTTVTAATEIGIIAAEM